MRQKCVRGQFAVVTLVLLLGLCLLSLYETTEERGCSLSITQMLLLYMCVPGYVLCRLPSLCSSIYYSEYIITGQIVSEENEMTLL